MLNPKNTPFDNWQDEIAREKYSALRRISENLSNCLKELELIDNNIKSAIAEDLSCHDINKMIENFNRMREDAEEWRYYLTVTMESSGFFYSRLNADVYRILLRMDPIS